MVKFFLMTSCLFLAPSLAGCVTEIGDREPMQGVSDQPNVGESESALVGSIPVPDQALTRFMVSVQVKVAGEWSHNCGGTIIGTRWIATAAHCVDVNGTSPPVPLSPSALTVVANTTDLTAVAPSNRHTIKRVVMYPGFDWGQRVGALNDVALLELDQALPASNVLDWDFRGALHPNDVVAALGWGATRQILAEEDLGLSPAAKSAAGTEEDRAGRRFAPSTHGLPSDWGGSNQLRGTLLKVVANDVCNNRFISGLAGLGFTQDDLPWATPESGEICAVSVDSEPRDHCYGDSGSPLIAYDSVRDRPVLVGIVSWGIGCADPRFPGVSQRVVAVKDFILSEL